MKVYSTGCPMCNIIIELLNKNNIKYELIEDEQEVLKVAKEYSVSSVPFAIINNKLYKASEIANYISNTKGD